MLLVVCSGGRVREIPYVMNNSSMGIVELLWYASMICVKRESQCVALEAVRVALWTALLQSIHWLYVYSHMVQMMMNVLVY